ncbi:hypothetical protein [Catellatospora sp. TT07R-123]|uniref:hypothetical protein n=1 Tax=Catellatospora sp. TT07R-123 TaxID=2733863 RepID=UPI001BB448F9|nr:hypothetical protein [Catellatospora sp. TT07R-123]
MLYFGRPGLRRLTPEARGHSTVITSLFGAVVLLSVVAFIGGLVTGHNPSGFLHTPFLVGMLVLVVTQLRRGVFVEGGSIVVSDGFRFQRFASTEIEAVVLRPDEQGERLWIDLSGGRRFETPVVVAERQGGIRRDIGMTRPNVKALITWLEQHREAARTGRPLP